MTQNGSVVACTDLNLDVREAEAATGARRWGRLPYIPLRRFSLRRNNH